MEHFVLDSDVLAMALFPEQRDDAITTLLHMAREGSLDLWVHPAVVTDCLTRLSKESSRELVEENGSHPPLGESMAELLQTVRLLPAPGIQLLQILHLQDNEWLTNLSVLSGLEYLEQCSLLRLAAAPAGLAVSTLTPRQCLEGLATQPASPQLPFVDLKAQQREIFPVLEANMFEVLRSCKFILGPEVQELERRLGEYTQIEHVVSCSSGTEALVLALMAYGIGPGDAVLTTPFSFIATAEVISLIGAMPVFVDIDPRTFNMDPDKLDEILTAMGTDAAPGLPAAAQGLRPRAVITVDLFGLPADHQRINAVARKHDIVVIEDAAQSFGGKEHQRKACALGHIGCTSFFPAKPLGGYGEGGACFTNDAGLAEVMRSMRVHGQGTSRYEHTRLGTNARLDSLQAAILLAKMDVFPMELESRTALAHSYSAGLASSELLPPFIPEGYTSAWAQYSVLAKNQQHRHSCQTALADQGIPSVIYYPVPLHLQQVFLPLGYQPGDMPVAESVSQHIFSLPMHPYLPRNARERIVDILRSSAG